MFGWFWQLLYKEREASTKPMEGSCRQIVDCLVMNVLKLEQKAVEVSAGTVSSMKWCTVQIANGIIIL